MKKRARALMDLQPYAVKSGHVLEAPHQLINALADSGDVDPHPDSVAYALDNGFTVVSFGLDEVAAPPAATEAPVRRPRKPKTEA
jgi:hypothetical protein